MNSLIILIDNIIYLYSIVLIVNIVLSWLTTFNIINISNRFVYAVLEASYKLTDPLLNPIRRVMPNIGGLDFSPVILFLLLGFLRNLLKRIWTRTAMIIDGKKVAEELEQKLNQI